MTFLMRNMPMTLSRFWNWWLFELRLLMPLWLKRLFIEPERYLLVRLSNFQVTYSYLDKGFEKFLGCFYMHQDGRAERDRFFSEQPQWHNLPIVLVLGAKQLLKKRLDLPLTVQHNLPQLLSYELDRFTPFKPETCYFLPLVLQKNKANNRLLLDLLFISKQKLHYYYHDLANFGIVLTNVVHEEDVLQFMLDKHFRYNLLPAEFLPPRHESPQWLNRLLAMCLVMLVSAALIIPFSFQQRTLTDLQQRIAVLKQQANEVEAIKSETKVMLDVEKKLRSIKLEAPVMLDVLEQLSSVLPKDTWLKNFEYEDRKFSLQGLSASASALISILEASPYFKQTTLVSPVTRAANEPLDQFQLETFLKKTQ